MKKSFFATLASVAVLKIEQPKLRALLMAATGELTIAEIAAINTAIPPEDTHAALSACCSKALMIG